MVKTIISGGQTGADRAALDWALEHGVNHRGWCPAGRRAEDGAIGPHYRLRETPGADYVIRTEWNVRDSDGTVIFTIMPILTGGSLATYRYSQQYRKPFLHLVKSVSPDPATELRQFLLVNNVNVLNVAGPRASGEPEIGPFVKSVLSATFEI